MNGVFDGSAGSGQRRVSDSQSRALPLGTNLISSYHVTGKPRYLLLHRTPSLTSSNGSSPQSTLFCCSFNAGLASTRYTCSTAEAKDRKLTIVYCAVRLFDDPAPAHKRRTRRISSIRVPLPGPTSIICTPSFFLPCASHSVTIHIPTNSPNI